MSVYSASTTKTLEKGVKKLRHRRRSGVFIVRFEQISDIFLVFLLFTLNM